MIDSISIAETGLRGFEKGLRSISNDTANLNTPGFKGGFTQFTDLFYGNNTPVSNGDAGFGQSGYGLNTLGVTLNLSQGQLQNTGNALDLAIDGQGFFVLKDASGNIHYTKDGQFKFDSSGTLVATATGEQVMATDGSGNLVPISLTNLYMGAAKATTTVTFNGNLSSTAISDTISNVSVIDNSGSTHNLTLNLVPDSSTPGRWSMTLKDGAATVGSGSIAFSNGLPVTGSAEVSLTYTPSGGSPVPLTLDFSSNVTSFDSGNSSSLAVSSQDGYAAGDLTKQDFDSTGTLVLTYSNGQTVKSKQLALGQFKSSDDIEAIGNAEYAAADGSQWKIGVAGTGSFGAVHSGVIEMSNVDLSQEFSNLVIMQRGYQACSQVVSTASDMLTTLFGMWNK